MKKQLCILLFLACAAWQGAAAAQIEISTLAELQAIGTDATTLSEAYVLVNDIDASATSSWNNGRGFKPLGDFTNRGFSGTFDGQGHVISNLYINRPDESGIGLFGTLDPAFTKGAIKNTGLENAAVIGQDWVGGLAGEIWGADGYAFHEISNCFITGMVSGRDYVGGLIGANDNGFITDSYSSCAVGGREYVGGLVSVVSFFAGTGTCFSTGAVSGSSIVGGLVGSQIRSYGDIMTSPVDNSYSTGAVNGVAYVGGLVGKSFDCDITNSYSTGPVAGTGDNVGGLVGGTDHSFGGSIAGCFWDTQTSGQSSAGAGVTGGAEGRTTAEMKTKSTFTEAGWDFAGIWGIFNDKTYPFFRWANVAPAAEPDSFAMLENTVLDVMAASGVLANDSDANGHSLTAELESTAANGSLELTSDGAFTYTPNADFTGTDSFTYRASDGEEVSAPATVTIEVQCLLSGLYGQRSAETELLRRYRDEVLATTPSGRAIIKLYYFYSPAIAALAARKAYWRRGAKKLMDKVLPALRRRLGE